MPAEPADATDRPATPAAPSAPRAPHVVVVGAGIAGLSAAVELVDSAGTAAGTAAGTVAGTAGGAGRPRVTVLEQADRVGGKLAGAEVAGTVVDVGAEALLARRPEAVELACRVGLADDLVTPATTSAVLWSRGRLHPLPRSVMGVPTALETIGGILTAAELAAAAGDETLPRVELGADIAIGALVAQRCGPAVAQRLVDPVLGGVYAGRAEELSLAATMPQLDAELRRTGRLLAAARGLAATDPADPGGSGQPPAFAGIRGGVHRLPSAAAEQLLAAGATVRTSCVVREIRRVAAGFELVCGPLWRSELVEADAVVVATAASPAARMLAALAPVAARELAAIDYASMAIVTLPVRRDGWPDRAGARGSGMLVPAIDGHLLKAATFSHRKWPWVAQATAASGRLLVRGSVGRIGEQQVLQRADFELAGVVSAELAAALGVAEVGEPAEAVVTRWGAALPQYRVGHRDRIDRIRSVIAAIPGLAVCGAAYDGIGIAACVASGRAAAREVGRHGRG